MAVKPFEREFQNLLGIVFSVDLYLDLDLIHLVLIVWQVADYFLLDLVSVFNLITSVVVY